MNTPSQKMREFSAVEKFSVKMTQWVGTPLSIVVHTLFFIGIFGLRKFGYTTEEIFLMLTTVVSLEAIYLAIFIQMTVNRQSKHLSMVRRNIKEISEDIEEIQEDVEGLGEDFEEISEDMEQEGVQEEAEKRERNQQIQKIENALQALLKDIAELHGKK